MTFSKRLSPTCFSVALFVALGLSASDPRAAFADTAHSAADIAQARELFQQAMAQRDTGDAEGALEKFKSAHALGGTPLTGLELGRTYMMTRRLVEASEVFLSIARIPVSSQETPRSTAARAEAEQLAKKAHARTPSVTVRVVGAPLAAVTVTLDGEPLPAAALAGARFVNPGSHFFSATTAAGGHAESSVTLAEGSTASVDLNLASGVAARGSEVSPAPPVATPSVSAPPPDVAPSASTSPSSHSYWTGRRILGVGIGLVGVAGLAVGTGVGLSANGEYSRAEGEAGAARRSDSSSAVSAGNVATVVFVAGAALAATGVIVWLTAPSAATQVGVDGREVIVRGTF
jgi:hypothetical protein